MMNSTVKEYLHTIDSIKEDLSKFELEQNKLKYQISHLLEENKRLTNELKDKVEIRFLQLSGSVIGQLQQNLQAAIASENAAVEMWQAAIQKLEKQEELFRGLRSIIATERSETEKQEEYKEEDVKLQNVLSEELSNSRREVICLKKDIEIRNTEIKNYKADLDSTKRELEISKRTSSELADTNDELTKKLNSIELSSSETDKALEACKKKISSLTAKNAELLISVSKLEDQNKKLKSEIIVYEKDAKKNLLAAEQEVICKEEHFKNKIKMLKSSIEVEKEKVSMRFKSEIEDIHKVASINIESLLSEMQNLYIEKGEKQFLQIQEEYVKDLNVLSEELSNSRREVICLKKDIEIRNTEIENYKADLDSTNRELEISQRSFSELADTNDKLKEKLNSIQLSFSEIDKALEACKEKISS